AVLPPFVRKGLFRLTFKHLGPGCMLDYGIYVRYPWRVSIGEGSALNRGCRLYPAQLADAEIIIGNHVAIGPDVRFYAAGHDYGSLDLKDVAGTIQVSDHAWIGGGAVILPGITIGQGAVIGAGAVVSKDVPAWTVVVGNPARVIKSRPKP